VNRVKILQEREMVHSGKDRDNPSYGGESAKSPGKREELKLHDAVIIKKIIKVVI